MMHGTYNVKFKENEVVYIRSEIEFKLNSNLSPHKYFVLYFYFWRPFLYRLDKVSDKWKEKTKGMFMWYIRILCYFSFTLSATFTIMKWNCY